MAPRHSRTPNALYFFLAVAGWLLHPVRGSTLYSFVIYGNGVPDSLQSQIDADANSLLRKLKSYEGAGYEAVAPGQLAAEDRRGREKDRSPGVVATTPETSEATDLEKVVNEATDLEVEKAEDENEEAEEENEYEEGDEDRRRRLISCPTKCSNSGSTYCRALGCAYCGTCNRRDRERNLRSFSLRGRGLARSAVSVEVALNKELATYCQDLPDCSLWAKIFVVNADGSLSLAT